MDAKAREVGVVVYVQYCTRNIIEISVQEFFSTLSHDGSIKSRVQTLIESNILDRYSRLLTYDTKVQI